MPPLPRGEESILVVDDNDGMRATAARNLAALGYRVRLAADGPSALAILQAKEHFDLLFTDVVMPNGLSGYQLAEAARALQPGLPVLFTTGFAAEDDGEAAVMDPDAPTQAVSPPRTRRARARDAGCRGTAPAGAERFQSVPVLPKPPPPRAVSSRLGTSCQRARTTGASTAWAMRVPRSTVNGASPAFSTMTWSSPR